MKLLGEIRGRARNVMGPVIGASLILYIGYHAVQGQHGLIAYWQMSRMADQARDVSAKLIREREAIKRRVRLLHPDSLDVDMLDERMRFMLGYGHADEKVIFLEKEPGGK
jgi:cell division protein FtsB